MAKTIAFRGKEKSDFAYYVAKSLAANEFTVAVIDNSYSKDLFISVNQLDEDLTSVAKENIIYLRDAVVDKDFTDKFDFVIYYLGLNLRPLTTEYSFILTDFSFTGISQMEALDGELLADSYYILRDKVSNKISEKSVAEVLKIHEDQIIGSLPLELKDEIAYLNFNYEGRQRIKDTSADMQYAVISAIAIITGDNAKEIKKYYRKAKRNRKI